MLTDIWVSTQYVVISQPIPTTRGGPQDLKANILSRRYNSCLLSQGSRNMYISIPTTHYPALSSFVPESAWNHTFISNIPILMPKTQATGRHIAANCHKAQKIPTA